MRNRPPKEEEEAEWEEEEDDVSGDEENEERCGNEVENAEVLGYLLTIVESLFKIRECPLFERCCGCLRKIEILE